MMEKCEFCGKECKNKQGLCIHQHYCKKSQKHYAHICSDCSKEVIRLYVVETHKPSQIAEILKIEQREVEKILKDNNIKRDIRGNRNPKKGKHYFLKNGRTHKIWNKGLTKETSNILVLIGKKTGMALRNKPSLRNMNTKNVDRYVKRLHVWKTTIKKEANFKCSLCGETQHLEIHHIKPYKDILKECCEKENLNIYEWKNWSQEEIERLRISVLNSHTPEIGICVCRLCHMKIDKNRFNFGRKEDKEIIIKKEKAQKAKNFLGFRTSCETIIVVTDQK